MNEMNDWFDYWWNRAVLQWMGHLTFLIKKVTRQFLTETLVLHPIKEPRQHWLHFVFQDCMLRPSSSINSKTPKCAWYSKCVFMSQHMIRLLICINLLMTDISLFSFLSDCSTVPLSNLNWRMWVWELVTSWRSRGLFCMMLTGK